MSLRKTTPIFIACVFSFGLIFFAVAKDQSIFPPKDTGRVGTDGKVDAGVRILVENALENSVDQDDDGDGLKNWEEIFWKTNPKVKDSDGDGISDSEEVKKTEKNIAYGAEASDNPATAVNSSNEPKTKTGEIGRNLFAEYLELKQSGRLNQSSMENLITKTLSQIDTKTSSFYSSGSVKTTLDTDTAGAKNYANALVTIREKYRALYNESPIITVAKTINFEDEASVESIRRAANLYKLEAQELASLIVPKSLVAGHLALLNSYAASAEGLAQFAELRSDPLMAVAGIQEHAAAVGQEFEIVLSISRFFESRGIVFESQEAGARIKNI